MPQMLMHIDHIGRQKQRDVLSIEFHNRFTEFDDDYQTNPSRQMIIDWLTANNIDHYPCGHFANDNMSMWYRGQIYIDVPFDDDNPAFLAVQSFMDNPDGSTKIDGAWLTYYPLASCMLNAHHDAPGYWEHLAEAS